MKFLKWFLGLFSIYAHPFERKVDRFFRHIKSTDNSLSVQRELLNFMKKNLVVVNVWMEKEYKGYKYLKKSHRKKMYENLHHIENKLEEFIARNRFSDEQIRLELNSKGLAFPTLEPEKIRRIYQIMQFLMPGNYYEYIKTASFGKLLRDPNKEKLKGDCNQIVTFYIYLYGLKFPMDDLQIKLLPEHVCLHFRGIDIEATNAHFENYKTYDHILPVTEIISTNLLDLTDFREEVQSIPPRVFVKSSQLAYAISSLREIVEKNLKAAYQNLGVDALKKNDFETAVFYFGKLGDRNLLNNVYRNAVAHFMKSKNYKKARFYASKTGDNELEKNVRRNQGIDYYNSGQISHALEVFSALGDEEMKKACYGKQYNELAKNVANVKTLEQARKKKKTYQKMLELAVKMGEIEMQEGLRKTLSQI